MQEGSPQFRSYRCNMILIIGSAGGFVLLLGLWSTLLAKDAPLVDVTSLKPVVKTDSCSTNGCHTSLTNRKFMHGPVAQDKCLACHEYDQPSEHRFKLIEETPALCSTCHTLAQRTVVHKPVKQGKCTSCHDPHGSPQRLMLVKDPTRGLCLSCHKQEGFLQKKFKHGPVAAQACIVCHEPHSSWQPNLLVKKPNQLCQSCHTEVLDNASGQPQHVHEALKQGCNRCHDPHASDMPFQLRQSTPQLCLNCHDDVKKQMKGAKVLHGALAQEGGCLSCHAPHQSPRAKLLRTSETTLCLTCHDKPIQTDQGRALTNMAQLLKDNPIQHGPIREDGCSACHQPHASQQASLLVKSYPPQFYAPFSAERYALCFTCHRAELVEDKQGVGLTRFRDKDTNLHWLHVNRKKGRTCRACHEVHASKKPFQIRDAVPFGTGGWMLEIGFEKTPTGGSCSPGCHDMRTYDYGHDATKPGATAKTGETK